MVSLVKLRFVTFNYINISCASSIYLNVVVSVVMKVENSIDFRVTSNS